MRKRRLFVIVFVVAAASLGIPTQVSAAPRIPRAVTAGRTVISQVKPGQSKTLSVAMPWRVNMIGASFLDPSHSQKDVTVVARAHTAAGWSSWEELGADDNGATGAEARHETTRVTTEAIWVGTADKIQVRVSVGPGVHAINDVRVHLINTLGDSQPENLFMRVIHSLGRFLTSTPAPDAPPAEAATLQPPIISRAQWGADASHLNLPCPGVASQLNMAFVHHTDNTNSYTKSQSAAIVRGIFRYHTDTRGYCDIAYNFVIDRYGQIFEGRLGGITNNVIGAHTGGYNYGSVGVALLGNFVNAKPTSAMIISLKNLLAWRLDIAHVPAIGTVTVRTGEGNDHHAAGSMVKFNRISGHSDASYTSCPGKYVYSLLPAIRSQVAAIGRPKIYLPTQSTYLLRPDGDANYESVTFTATLSNAATWILTVTSPTGAVARTFRVYSSSVSATWDGKTAQGVLVPTGLYRWDLQAIDTAKHSARAFRGYLSVVTSHPDGTILSDATGTYLVDGGKARAVDSTAYLSNFGTRAAVQTGPAERARYGVGTPLGLREGTLFVSSGEHYIWSGGALRHFDTQPIDTYTALGFGSAPAITATPTYLSALHGGSPITQSDVAEHPDGTAVKNPVGGALYVLESGTRRPATALAIVSWYQSKEIVAASSADLALPLGTPFLVREGTLVKDPAGGAPWIVSDGQRRPFFSLGFANLMGYSTAMMVSSTAADLNAIPIGPRVG